MPETAYRQTVGRLAIGGVAETGSRHYCRFPQVVSTSGSDRAVTDITLLGEGRTCTTIARVYSARLLDHFEHPRNVGEIPGADASVCVENPACGDILQLTLKLADGRIVEARYRSRGCVASIACGSALTEMLLGLTPAQAAALRREAVVAAVDGLPKESLHASHLALDALEAALKQLGP